MSCGRTTVNFCNARKLFRLRCNWTQWRPSPLGVTVVPLGDGGGVSAATPCAAPTSVDSRPQAFIWRCYSRMESFVQPFIRRPSVSHLGRRHDNERANDPQSNRCPQHRRDVPAARVERRACGIKTMCSVWFSGLGSDTACAGVYFPWSCRQRAASAVVSRLLGFVSLVVLFAGQLHRNINGPGRRIWFGASTGKAGPPPPSYYVTAMGDRIVEVCFKAEQPSNLVILVSLAVGARTLRAIVYRLTH